MAALVSRLIAALVLACALSLPARTAEAQVILRDAEIERALRELARPIIAQSGLSPGRIRILMIKDDRLNAFVLDSQTIFLNSGLILRMERPAQLQAVIAHEIAHIANGHLTRRPANARAARSAALWGLLLSAAVAAKDPKAGAGVALGSQASAGRVFLSHTRAEEASADQAGLRYMARANVDPTGMVEVMQLFSGQEALSQSRQDPYVRTHPLSRERVRALKGFAAAHKEIDKASAESLYWFNRAKGKLSAYIRNPKWTLRRVGKSDTSDTARLRRALAYHKNSDTKRALNEMNALLAKRPKDPYMHELKGQILLESRQFGPAVKSYARAASLSPKQPLILAGYGQALLATDTKGNTAKALQVLERARSRDPYNPRLMRSLALAYAKSGNRGMAALSTAERYAVQGKLKDAGIHAKRAVDLLPRGSAGWRRADDILAAAKVAAKRGKKRR